MTQKQDGTQKLAEMNAIFLGLNEKGQESALMILKSLEFAQSVMCGKKGEQSREKNITHFFYPCCYILFIWLFFSPR